MKVLVVMGTRPEVIKLAPVVIELRKQSINTVICSTGQHREMLKQSLEVFYLLPDIELNVMEAGQSLNKLAAKLMSQIDDVMLAEKPDWVVIQGDTTTAFCAGWAAFQRNIKVAHIEAGLRTGNMQSPFPEEANRCLIAKIASLHFAPTLQSKQHLLLEGVREEDIRLVGNTVVDALDLARGLEPIIQRIVRIRNACPEAEGKKLILVTCHRRENFGDVLEEICLILKELATTYFQYHWIFPVHLNPQVQEPVKRILNHLPNLSLIPPTDYLTTIAILENSVLVISDSGGIQEEAPSFGVPVVVMRNYTERLEGVEAGFAILAGQTAGSIEKAVKECLENPDLLKKIAITKNPYGDGFASVRVVAALQNEIFADFSG